MAVIGGNTKSLPARIVEVAGWFPVLAALVAAGSLSFLQANHITHLPLPDWAKSALGFYRNLRDRGAEWALGKSVSPNYADLAVAGIALVTLAARQAVSFVFSIGGFLVLAALAWFVMKRLS